MAEQYLVSARKYRPQLFDSVVGQSHITTTLKNAIRQQQLAHAFLFCGPRGVGKTTCARILAKTINCENPTADIEACGVCSTCVSFDNQSSFNVFELDAASNNSVDDIRELVNQVRFAPQHGKYKIYIIDEVHMLSASAFNAFLKTLEEPPPYAIFILATTEKHKILPTILSRCQIFDFKRISTKSVVDHLHSIAIREHVQAEDEALHMIAVKSEGCMRDALSMFDRIASFTNGQMTYANTMEHLNLLDAEFYFQLGDQLLAKDVPGVMVALDEILDKGFEGNVVLEGLAEHYRNVLLCKEVRMAQLLDVPAAHKRVYFEKAQIIPSSFLLNALQIINEAVLQYRNTNNKRLHTEVCLLRLCFLNDLAAAAEQKKNIAADSPTVDKETSSKPSPTVKAESYKSSSTSQPKVTSTDTLVKDSTLHPRQSSTYTEVPEKHTAINDIPEIVNTPPKTKPEEQPGTSKSPFGTRVQAGQASKLSQLQQQIKEQKEIPSKAAMELTQDNVLNVFADYLSEVKMSGNKNTYAVYLQNVAIETQPPDTIQLLCTDPLAEAFIRGRKDHIIDFLFHKMNRRVLIDIILEVDESQPKNKVLSKQEMFEIMLNENPAFRDLHNTFQFTIE